MNVTQNYFNVTALKGAITASRQEAKEEAQRNCPRGMLVSRGAWIRVADATGHLTMGEADSWAFEGTAKQFEELANLLRYDSKAHSITIEGGWDWALNPRDYKDGAYDAWVSEWAVEFGTKKEEPAPAPAPAAQEPAGQEPAASVIATQAVAVEATDTKAQVLAQFRETLEEAQKELARANRGPVVYVVICESLPLAFTIENNVADKPVIAKPWRATRFSLRDATAVAATVKNGHGKVGEVHTLAEAIESEIKTLTHLIGVLGAA